MFSVLGTKVCKRMGLEYSGATKQTDYLPHGQTLLLNDELIRERGLWLDSAGLCQGQVATVNLWGCMKLCEISWPDNSLSASREKWYSVQSVRARIKTAPNRTPTPNGTKHSPAKYQFVAVVLTVVRIICHTCEQLKSEWPVTSNQSLCPFFKCCYGYRVTCIVAIET